jgi:hypothetical protein
MWRSGSSVEEWEQCGGVGAMWRSGSDVEEWEQCGGVGAMWRSGSSVEEWEQCGGCIVKLTFACCFCAALTTLNAADSAL